MNILTTKPTRLFAAMTAVIIMAFAMVMTVSAQARPERPTDLTATAIDHNTVSLTWSHPNPANVDHYQVLSRRADSGTGTTQVGTSTTTSFLHDGLEPESTYIYRVRPVNSQGEEGQRSARSEATTPADETPAPEPEPTPAPPQRSDDEGQDNTARSSHDVLVSNIGKLSASESALSLFDHAQGFATGANISGYTLTSIEVKFDSAADTPPTTVALHTSVAPLDTTIASLTGPTTIVAGNNTFTAPSGTILDANTTYYIVIEGGNATVSATSTDSDDSSSLSDWDVLSDGHYRAAASTGNFAVSSHSKQVRVNGAVSTSTTSTDATLSDLELEDNTSTDITLTPTFASATTTYTAQVVNSVDEITITPTVNDSTASYDIQDNSGTALTDADTNTTGFQVDLSEGANIIKVEVEAENASTETYTVTITRAVAATPPTEIPNGWSLKPSGLSAGDQFRLIFLSSTKRDGSSTNIATYNTFVQTRAAAGRTAIQAYSDGFTAVGCTENVDAVDNTGTTGVGVPIYWLNGAKVADNYADFYDGDWDDESNDKNELGTNGPDTSLAANYPITGCDHDGTEAFSLSGLTRALGSSDDSVRVGRPNSSTTGNGPISNLTTGATNTTDRPMYGLSQVFEVVALPALSFQSNNITVNEDDSQATVSVLLSQASTDTVTVDYATSDNTAEAGDDYTETSGTLTFAAGETSKTVTITLLNDGVYEDSERFSFTLNNPTGTTLPTFPSARVNILDDESPPTASIANVTVGEGAGTMTLTLNLSHESSRSTSYETTTSDVGGTATAGSDYVSFLLIGGNARITVPTGYTQVNFNITITDDTAAESSETITIHWEHDPTGVNGDATPATIDFTGTITDNDSTDSSDATLSALVVRDDAEKRRLTPGFTPGTYAYATQVVNAATTATLTATPNHAEAEVTAVTLAGTAIADSNLSDAITVPSLVVGDNVIVVTVTAQDASTQDYTVTLTRAPALPAVNIVPSSWSLKPAGLSAGEFRLIFLSSTKHNAESSNIGTYNTFVQNRAAAGHADIREYSSAFKVVGCTADVDARDNTGTTHTSADRGVPIYWLNGNKVADQYQDFYDGSWDDEANDRNQSGNDAHDTSQTGNYPYTGCDHNGTESISGNSLALGQTAVRTGEPNYSIGTRGPLQGAGSSTSDNPRPFYGLSSVFQVDATSDVNLSIAPASDIEGYEILFTVNLSEASADDVTFDYATSIESDDNSEVIDFTQTAGTGTIAAGNTSTTFTVLTYNDGRNNANSVYEGDETFTVTISNPAFAGISQATAKGTIIDDEDVPTASFRTVSQSELENSGTINNFIQFDIAPLNEGPAQISLTITGTATAGQDYETPDTTLTLPPGQNQLSEPITINNDDVYERSETVTVQLVAVSDNIQIEPTFNTKTLIILDNDDPPVLSFEDPTIIVNEDAGPAVLTVNKTGATQLTATVDYATVPGGSPAKEGKDYTATAGTLTFLPGDTSKAITIPILDDNVYEGFERIYVELTNPYRADVPEIPDPYRAVADIQSDDPVPTASMANVTANERAGTMTVTIRLSNPSSQDIQYIANDSSVTGTATRDEDYVDFIPGAQAYITVSAGQQSGHFDITLIDDGLEEEDESIHIRWVRRGASMANPEYLDFNGTITDPPICDALGNLENAIVVMNLTGEITQPGQSKFHRIKLDPYRSYLIEAIGQVGQDMLGVEEHANLTLSNPDIPAIWNAKATSKWITYGDRNDGAGAKNVIRRFLDSGYRTYKVEVNAGNNGTGTYQLKIRLNNICRLDENENAHYQWAGGPKGYPANSDLPAGTGGRQVLLAGTDWGNDNVTRPEMHHVLGDNWNSNRDEDWIGVDLEGGAEYTVRLRTKNSLPERLQATGLKILGMKDESGNAIAGTASTGSIGTTVFLTNFEAPSTGRFYIAVGSEGTDRTGTYWLSIYKQIPE